MNISSRALLIVRFVLKYVQLHYSRITTANVFLTSELGFDV